MISKNQIETYMPREIKRICKEIPEKIAEYYRRYEYGTEMEKYANFVLHLYGIRKEQYFYQECLSNCHIGYLYAIGRCAYKEYRGDHVKNYIKLMIRISIIYGINTSDEVGQICKETHMKAVYLDDDTRTRLK